MKLPEFSKPDISGKDVAKGLRVAAAGVAVVGGLVATSGRVDSQTDSALFTPAEPIITHLIDNGKYLQPGYQQWEIPHLTLADRNGDGRLDIALDLDSRIYDSGQNLNETFFLFYDQTVDGRFQLTQTIKSPVNPSIPSNFRFADLDQDNWPDLLATGTSVQPSDPMASSIEILWNEKGRGFTETTLAAKGDYVDDFSGALAISKTRDATLLGLIGYGSHDLKNGTVDVPLNIFRVGKDRKISLVKSYSRPLYSYGGFDDVYAGDFENNGTDDFITNGTLDENGVFVSRNGFSVIKLDQNGVIIGEDSYPFVEGTGPVIERSLFGDYTGDGKTDLLNDYPDPAVPDPDECALSLYEQKNGRLQKTAVFNYNENLIGCYVFPNKLTDVDGDGRKDLVGILYDTLGELTDRDSSHYQQQIATILNPGLVNTRIVTNFSPLNLSIGWDNYPDGQVIIDIDGDGDDDVFSLFSNRNYYDSKYYGKQGVAVSYNRRGLSGSIKPPIDFTNYRFFPFAQK